MNRATPVLRLAECGLETAARALADTMELPEGVALVPTETVYGLVCCADDPKAIQRIFYLKQREAAKPLGWFIDDWKKLAAFGIVLSGLPQLLAEKYCPGAITIIAPKKDGSTQGFRVPDHPLLAMALPQIPVPLVQTSANRSGAPNALTVEEALAELTDFVDLAIDGGPISGNAQASTVVLATGSEPKILRQGSLKIQI